MKVSILIPAFNASDFIAETLDSCIQQGEDVVKEIIVVDDHSDDDTKSLLTSKSKRSKKNRCHFSSKDPDQSSTPQWKLFNEEIGLRSKRLQSNQKEENVTYPLAERCRIISETGRRGSQPTEAISFFSKHTYITIFA
jgi:glycosyltransferase involved in cell wall biosynthesis